MTFTKNIGMLLLAIYLILVAISHFMPTGIFEPVLALLAGVFILLGR